MRFQHNPLRVEQVYKAMTWEKRKQVIREIRATLDARGKPVSPDFLEQVLTCARPHPPSRDVAEAVSQYFMGVHGINMTVEDVLPPVAAEAQGG